MGILIHILSYDYGSVWVKTRMMDFASQTHLLMIADGQRRFEVALAGPTYSIGRDPNCDIRLVSQFVSRRHATLIQLLQEDGSFSYRIVDGAPRGRLSANGLLVNGCKLQAHNLQHEDEIVFAGSVRAVYIRKAESDLALTPLDGFGVTLIDADD